MTGAGFTFAAGVTRLRKSRIVQLRIDGHLLNDDLFRSIDIVWTALRLQPTARRYVPIRDLCGS